jgi:hypothetical protein
MSEDDLKLVLTKYQQKSFELFNQNIVLETQVENLQKQVASLREDLEKSKTKKTTRASSNDF